MNDKIIQIEQCNEGYIVKDMQTAERYAVTKDGLVRKIKDLLKITDKTTHKLTEEPVIIPKPTPPSSPPPEQEQEHEPEPEPKTEPTARQKIKELVQVKDPDGLFIPKFNYDPAQKKEIKGYTNISVVEMPDGRALIQYKAAHYYTTKEKVMKLPFPIPKNYFKNPGLGISSVAQTCLTAYRSHLANLLPEDKSLEIDWEDDSGSIAFREHEKKIKEQEQGDEQGTCDDIAFDSCANNSPENCKHCVNGSRYENKNKLAAKKPAPPQMKATIEP